jgi:hypothetical protein
MRIFFVGYCTYVSYTLEPHLRENPEKVHKTGKRCILRKYLKRLPRGGKAHFSQFSTLKSFFLLIVLGNPPQK